MMTRKRIPACSVCGLDDMQPGKITLDSFWGEFSCSLLGVPALICKADGEYVLDMGTANLVQMLTIFLSHKHKEIKRMDTTNLWLHVGNIDLLKELINQLNQEKIVVLKKDSEMYYVPDIFVRRISAFKTKSSGEYIEEIKLAARDGVISDNDKEKIIKEIKKEEL